MCNMFYNGPCLDLDPDLPNDEAILTAETAECHDTPYTGRAVYTLHHRTAQYFNSTVQHC